MTGSEEAIHASTQKEEWIVSSLSFPCANASRLSQAMTVAAPLLGTIRNKSRLLKPLLQVSGGCG
jgi:hypothetical protein